MKLIKTYLSDVLLMEISVFEDQRGVFSKIFHSKGEPFRSFTIKQINHVATLERGMLRGLHAQEMAYSETKVFKVLKGKVQLVFFDLKSGKSGTVQLINDRQICLVPKGYATGYLALEDWTEVLYYSDNEYQPDRELGVRWNDPSLDIKWLIDQPIVSSKDIKWPDWHNKYVD